MTGEDALWWAMIRQASVDILRAHESEALDAAEFLYSTGVWLCEELFHVEKGKTQKELVKLMRRSRTLRGKINGLATTETT